MDGRYSGDSNFEECLNQERMVEAVDMVHGHLPRTLRFPNSSLVPKPVDRELLGISQSEAEYETRKEVEWRLNLRAEETMQLVI